jgi:hypothetical protein
MVWATRVLWTRRSDYRIIVRFKRAGSPTENQSQKRSRYDVFRLQSSCSIKKEMVEWYLAIKGEVKAGMMVRGDYRHVVNGGSSRGLPFAAGRAEYERKLQRC